MYILILLLDYYSNQGTGGWSTEGIIQDDNPVLPVLCNTTHLTSFSVLQQQPMSAVVEVCFTMCLHTLVMDVVHMWI